VSDALHADEPQAASAVGTRTQPIDKVGAPFSLKYSINLKAVELGYFFTNIL
jgi:hypothetical protein